MKDNFKENVAAELRSLRGKSNMKQKEVAEKAGIDTMTIVRYENNNVSMQLDMLEKIVKVYNVKIDIFFDNVYANMQKQRNEN